MSKEISIGEALRDFLSQSRLKSGIQGLRVEEIWEEVMGKVIAKYTEKIQVINGTLFITTHMAPLKQELLYQKELIIRRVNEAMGEKIIQDMVIQ